MFGVLGLTEVILLVVMGAISAPLFLRPRGRTGPVLVVTRFDVGQDAWPAVSIEGRQSGLIPHLLALVGVDKATTLEVTEELITFERAGIWREQRTAIPLAQVASAQCATSQPVWHLSAIGVITVYLFIAASAERLTSQMFGAGVIAAGVCGVLCALQCTVDLVIETSGGTTIALSFTALSVRRTITLQDVIHAAERITELAMLNQRRTTD
jgi:hypothetical protein